MTSSLVVTTGLINAIYCLDYKPQASLYDYSYLPWIYSCILKALAGDKWLASQYNPISTKIDNIWDLSFHAHMHARTHGDDVYTCPTGRHKWNVPTGPLKEIPPPRPAANETSDVYSSMSYISMCNRSSVNKQTNKHTSKPLPHVHKLFLGELHWGQGTYVG